MRSTTRILCAILLLAPLGVFAQNPEVIKPSETEDYEGQFVQVCGVIAEATYARSIKGKPTYLTFTREYPKHEFTTIIWGDDRKNFEYKPETLENHMACVYGKIDVYRGRPQMSISIPDQISARPLTDQVNDAPATQDGDSEPD